MKKVIRIFIIHYSLFIAHCFAQWSVVSTSGNEAVSFPSENTGYSTANGITKKTTNGGVTWTTLSGGNLTGIFFINDLTGWVVGYPGYIGRTTTGGSFTQQTSGVTDRLNDVFFINPDTGWVVGGDYSTERIFKTTNGGVNWLAQSSGTANKLFSVYFINAYTGWSVGGPSSPKIIKTTDGGTTWLTESTSVGTPLYFVKFADANTGWAVAGYIGGETIINTTNGGATWQSQSSGDNRYLRWCFALNNTTAFAVGQSGKIITTTNGGANWLVQASPTTSELWSIDFVNDSVGYAIGDNVVVKTTNAGLTFMNGNRAEVANEFQLYQNYPNPFNPSTVIKFSIPGSVGVAYMRPLQLKVYNVLGKEVATLVNQQMQPGSYSVDFDGSNLSSGIYYYSLIIDNAILDTKKLVLLK